MPGTMSLANRWRMGKPGISFWYYSGTGEKEKLKVFFVLKYWEVALIGRCSHQNCIKKSYCLLLSAFLPQLTPPFPLSRCSGPLMASCYRLVAMAQSQTCWQHLHSGLRTGIYAAKIKLVALWFKTKSGIGTVHGRYMQIAHTLYTRIVCVFVKINMHALSVKHI